jgi:hypothetical protein
MMSSEIIEGLIILAHEPTRGLLSLGITLAALKLRSVTLCGTV